MEAWNSQRIIHWERRPGRFGPEYEVVMGDESPRAYAFDLRSDGAVVRVTVWCDGFEEAVWDRQMSEPATLDELYHPTWKRRS